MNAKGLFGVVITIAITACASPAPATPTPTPASGPGLAPTETPTATAAVTPTPMPMASATPEVVATSEPTQVPPTAPSTPKGAPPILYGGVLHLLMTSAEANGGVNFEDFDPQRIYNGEDQAFFRATMFRTLTTFTPASDPSEANTLVPDAATNTGTPNADFTQWSFTLRDGPMWQDGSAVTCQDFKYGVSRTFATVPGRHRSRWPLPLGAVRVLAVFAALREAVES